jgi:hypothetical protein
LFLFALVLNLSLVSCASPSAVSAFSASAVTTLAAASQVFGDMEPSCLREVDSRAPFGSFQVLVQHDPGCDRIATQAESAQASVRILSDYFRAMNALASFGTATAGTDAQGLLSRAGSAMGSSPEAQNALGSLAQLLVSAGTSGYQLKHLEKDLVRVNADVSAVLAALIRIIQRNYVDQLLGSEEQKLRTRYREFSQGKTSPELILMLEDRWRGDEQMLQARRASAQSMVTALETLSKGFADLASNGRRLTAKEVPGLLEPYVTQMQNLIPQVQKAF